MSDVAVNGKLFNIIWSSNLSSIQNFKKWKLNPLKFIGSLSLNSTLKLNGLKIDELFLSSISLWYTKISGPSKSLSISLSKFKFKLPRNFWNSS